MARTRGMIIDNSATVGAIYTAISKTSEASSVNTITSGVLKQAAIEIKPVGMPVSKVTATSGWKAASNISILSVSAELRGKLSSDIAYPTGKSLIVSLRKKSSANVTTSLGTVTLPINGTSNTITTNYSVNVNDNVFVDVTQVGTTRTGLGLIVYLRYV
jgi:hypothetical protein